MPPCYYSPVVGTGCTISLGVLLSGNVRAGAGGPDGVTADGADGAADDAGTAPVEGTAPAAGAGAVASIELLYVGVHPLGGASPGGTGGGGSGVGDTTTVTVAPNRDCHSASRRR